MKASLASPSRQNTTVDCAVALDRRHQHIKGCGERGSTFHELIHILIRHIRGNSSSNNASMPWSKGGLDDRDIQDAEAYEFVEHEPSPRFSPRSLGKQAAYEEGSSIDWVREEAAERERMRGIRSRRGLKGLLGVVLDSAGLWFVIILAGVGVGVLGAWLDVLVKWCVLCSCGIRGVIRGVVVGLGIYEKDAAGMGSSTTKLHAVVGWIVSETETFCARCDLTPRI